MAQDLIERLAGIVGPPQVLVRPQERLVYRSDGNTLFQALPRVVVLPGDREEVAAVMRLCHEAGVPVVPRGAGTGLSGGALPSPEAVLLGLNRLTRIRHVDVRNRCALVEAGVINAHLSEAVRPYGLYYAPDPSSQAACTIGGNIAENSGGAHCLKYGATSQHVLGLEVVCEDGSVLTLGGPERDRPGLDLRGLLVGSEGTMAVVTAAWVRLLPLPPAVETVLALFDHVEEAAEAVSQVIAAGVLPAALEMMDRLAITAVERGAYPVGFPPDLEAVLLLEVDGGAAEVAEEVADILAVVGRLQPRAVRRAETQAERARWWANRKTAFGSMGKIAPAYYVQDGVIPRSELAPVLASVRAIARSYDLPVANVFHAGDGNLHPLLAFDPRTPGATARALEAGSAILKACVDAGGSITGEHGVGVEKQSEMAYMFGAADLALMARVRRAITPDGRMNPGKVLPTPALCIDGRPRPWSTSARPGSEPTVS
jgi:glycolate oxidase subunit GlcD